MLRSVALCLFMVLAITALSACSAPQPLVDGTTAATTRRYREGEVRAYEGALLDPLVGPRDNSIKGIQQVDMEAYTLTVDGLVDTEIALTYDAVRAMEAYERKITLYCVEGWQATILWQGVRLSDLIDLAGANPEAVTVIFTSVDGYTTSLPLQTVRDKELLLAYRANGLGLPAAMGYPFIVVAEDRLGYKWARWVCRITLSDDAAYRGYWEQRGYSNDAATGKE